MQSAIQRFASEAIVALCNATDLMAAANPPAAAVVAAAEAAVAAGLASMDKLFAAERAAEGDAEWR